MVSFVTMAKTSLLIWQCTGLDRAGNSERRPWGVVQENEPQQIPVYERSYYKTLAILEASGKAI